MKDKPITLLLGSFLLLSMMILGLLITFFPDWIAPFDQVLTALIRQPYPDWTPFYLGITQLGNPLSITLFTSCSVLFLFFHKYYNEALWLATGVIGVAAVFNPVVKLLFARERPHLDQLISVQSFSYPSGHSTGSLVLFGTLICLLAVLVKNRYLLWLLRVGLSALILGIGLSRIYLGVHYPSDVLGGYCVGLAWLFLSYPLYQANYFRKHFMPKQL